MHRYQLFILLWDMGIAGFPEDYEEVKDMTDFIPKLELIYQDQSFIYAGE